MAHCLWNSRRDVLWPSAILLTAIMLLVGGCQQRDASIAAAKPTDSHPAADATPNLNPPSGPQFADTTPSTDRSDAIVVGAGISGLCAALDLARGGASVTLIDMASVYGGHAVMSQGSVSIVDTPLQRAKGINDPPELAFDDIIRFGDDADVPWARYYVENSRRDIYDWLIELGVRFEAVASSPGNSVEREHQPAGRGIGLVTPIYRACLDQPNLRFQWNAKVEQLVSTDGRVSGVVARNLRTGDQHTYHAGSVVLATGGFQSNLDMVREFWPAEFRFPDRILVGSGKNSIGLGHKLAESVGGTLSKMDHQWNYFTGIPDPRFPGTNRGLSAANMYGIIVNAEGRRFANLHGWAKAVVPALLKQKQATLWFIFDEAAKPFFVVSGSDWADFKHVEKVILSNTELVKKADTLEALARQAGLPAQNVVETVNRYNQLVDRGVDEDFGRFGKARSVFPATASPRLVTPPFYAMQAWPLTRKSMGGVAIDQQCRVLDKQQQPIPGLFAVGELTGLAGINGKAALEGTFLGPCVVTGRIAARTIIADLNRPSPPEAHARTRCTECHDIPDLVAEPRPGYWHFEQVHRVTQTRGTDCRFCHAELTPYRAQSHRTNPQSLTASCVQCHLARE